MVIITADKTGERMVIETDKELANYITNNLVGYKDSEENGIYTYEIPPFPNNCFTLWYLVKKRPDIFAFDEDIIEVVMEICNTVPTPYCYIMNDNQIGVKCPPVHTYEQLLSLLGGKPAMRGTWRIPFTRLYEAYNVLSKWQHGFLPPFVIGEDLKELVNYPITHEGNELSDLRDIKLTELYSVHYGYQINTAGFNRLKYNSAADILLRRPLRYTDKSEILSLDEVGFGRAFQIRGKILQIGTSFSKSLELKLRELSTDSVISVSFYGNGWLSKLYNVGDTVVVSVQRVGRSKVNFIGHSIDLESITLCRPVEPIYRQSPKNHITSRVLSQCVDEIFHRFNGEKIADYIEWTDRPLWESLKALHFPKSPEEYSTVLDNLAYTELLFLQLMFKDKEAHNTAQGLAKSPTGKTHYMEEALNHLPFELTNGQKEAVKHFKSSLRSTKAEKILLSADVGAGKTLCAQLACLYTLDSGYQSVLAGPTEILARQLYDTFIKLITPLENKPNIAYLSGNTKAAEKREILKGIANGSIDILVGTHGVFNVENWHNLGLIVIDEQQKFGTEQREKLLTVRKDGCVPDVISQTATPIPRSTALAFYGDVDLVQIEEKPNNRKPISTMLVDDTDSEMFLQNGDLLVWPNIMRELDQGHQMFIVAPAVEEDSKVISVGKIKKILDKNPKINCIDISGKMSKEKQNKILEEFKDGKYNTLIASSIVEVGIDVPNATVMVVLGADRFGASSLHQIRGRVGRSDLQSYCYLVPDSFSESSVSRLSSLVNSNNGFEIALADLSTRKEGDLLGSRQAGTSNLLFSNLVDHTSLLMQAREEAERIYNSKYKERALEDAKYLLDLEEEEEKC